MASAAVNGIPAPSLTPESFLECCSAAASPAARGWLSPRISFSLDLEDPHAADDGVLPSLPRERAVVVGKGGAGEFEFRLEDSISMLPADELFSEGKLLPLYLAAIRPAVEAAAAAAGEAAGEGEEVVVEEISAPEAVAAALPDPYLFSPKAPRCSTRWRELLRLKKAAVAAALSSKAESKAEATTSTASSSTSSASSNVRKLRFFLHRSPKPSAPSGSDPSLSLPLLQTSPESDPAPTSSRPSSPDRLDLPRLSLDSERPSQKHASAACSGTPPRPRSSYKCSSRARPLPDHPLARSGRSLSRRAPEEAAPRRGVSVDSPRMNPSGKIVFHGLERSSSSPGSFNGGPRPKHRPMERSYSANVRVSPVINIIGFGPLFSSSSSSQKKDAAAKSRGKGKAASAAAAKTTS